MKDERAVFMTIKDLEKEFKVREGSNMGLQVLLLIVFLGAVPMAIILFNPFFLVVGVIALIVDGVVASKRKRRMRIYIMDNKDKLDKEELERLDSYLKWH